MNTATQITDATGRQLLEIQNGDTTPSEELERAGLIKFVRGIDGMLASELTDEGREALACWLGADEAGEVGLVLS